MSDRRTFSRTDREDGQRRLQYPHRFFKKAWDNNCLVVIQSNLVNSKSPRGVPWLSQVECLIQDQGVVDSRVLWRHCVMSLNIGFFGGAKKMNKQKKW